MPNLGSANSRGRRWLRWARVLIVGMVSGGVQIFLLLSAGLSLKPYLVGLPLNWPFLLVVVLSACAYLVLALLEGGLAASRTGTIAAGKAAGQLVGGIGALIVTIAIVVLVVIMFTTPRSTTSEIDPHDLRPPIAMLLFLLALLQGLWAWGVSRFGGWIGGVVGQRLAPRSSQSSPPGEAARR
jgi:hypothetical protein